MSKPNLEQRVLKLEQQMAEVLSALQKVTSLQDWRSTLGMFSGNEAMKEIDAAGQAVREKERQPLRHRVKKGRRVSA